MGPQRSITTRLVDTAAIPMLLTLVQSGKLKPGQLVTHRFPLSDVMMANAGRRTTDEIERLGGDYAHVHGESLGAKHDDVAAEDGCTARFNTCCIAPAGLKAKLAYEQ